MATWWGNNNDNHHKGPQKTQYGLGGDDTLVTTHKNRSYSLYGGDGDDELVGYDVDDQLYGGSGDDNLYGYGGRDYLEGGGGKDKLGGFSETIPCRGAAARTRSSLRPSSITSRTSTGFSISTPATT